MIRFGQVAAATITSALLLSACDVYRQPVSKIDPVTAAESRLSAEPGAPTQASSPVETDEADFLQPVANFDGISNEANRSVALFKEMGKVLQHPRCMNCHPRGDSPRQGLDMTLHNPPVVRGPDNKGAAAMECSTCHGYTNFTYAVGPGSLPGHPNWHVAPLEMAWVGKSLAAICEQLKDQSRSHKTLEELHEHNATDGLVGWAWNPGAGRQSAPGTQQQFGELTRAWIDSGAECPGQ